MGNLTDEQINNLIKVAGLSIADLPETHKELHRMIWDAYEAGTKVSQVEPEVKPACGKCIDCKFYVDMDYQKDIQNACSNGNIVFGYIPMEADKFGCIYFESKSV